MTDPRISLDPRQMNGTPCIRHLRIPAATVAAMVADGGAPCAGAGRSGRVHRLERGLCNYQDLYVAVLEPGVAPGLNLYSSRHRADAVLMDDRRVPGTYTTPLDGAGLPSGLYFYPFEAGGYHEARTMLLVK